MSFRQDRTNPSTAVSNWHGRSETPKGWPSTRVSTWMNGGLFGAAGPTGEFEYLAGFTAGGSDHTYDFTSISQGYKTLRVVAYVKAKASNQWRPYMRLNGDTGNYYYATALYAQSSSLSDASYANIPSISMPLTPPVDYPWVYLAELPGYTNSSIVSPTINYAGIWNNSGSTSDRMMFGGGLWNGTAAITAVRLYDASSNTLAAGSKVALFGMKDDS